MCSIWVFTPLHIYPDIKYADTLIVISACQLVLLIPKKKRGDVDTSESFYDDKSLGAEGTDELGYLCYAQMLGERIISSNFDNSFAIGINGHWGSGKTSFIDLLKRKIKSDEIIEINFTAWNSHSPKAIIKDFFETIQETIRPYHSSLSRQLIKYSNKLVDLNSNTVTQSIQTTVSALSGFDSLNSLYKDINDSLRTINKKIIIYIDDLDRLDKDEIVEVLRLIRNTANFHNTFFIVAYDRNYVANALRQHNSYNQEAFLEKIFQIEISLPFYKKDVLRYRLAEKLKQRLPQGFHADLETKIIGSNSSVPNFINDWLDSMRDVTRLANSLLLNLSNLQGEIDFDDFMRMELLRLEYPIAHELLYKNRSHFFDTTSDHGSKENHYRLKSIPDNTVNLTANEKNIITFFELHLVRNYMDLSIPKDDISKIVSFLNDVFRGDHSFPSFSTSHLSIIYPSKFNRYFAYALLNGALSEIVFSKARESEQSEFNNQITKWVQQGLEHEVKNRFYNIDSFDDRVDFEKIVLAIFHLAKQPTQNNHWGSKTITGYDGKDLISKLANHITAIVLPFYPEEDGQEVLRTFIENIFIQAISPYSFEAELLRQLDNRFDDLFILSKQRMEELNINYLRTYCRENHQLDRSVWNLFHSCQRTEWISSGADSYTTRNRMPESAKSIMKDFVINKDLDGFLYEIISPEVFDKTTYSVSNFIVSLFGDWKSFETILASKTIEDASYLDEFNLFLAKFASQGYSKYVDFDFKIIPVHNKFNNNRK